MTFLWPTAIYQLIVLVLVILFFVSLCLFVNRMIKNSRETKASLKRLEEKMEIILEEIKNKN
ncbi:DUF4083 family protein [Paenibacillus azoreducens]|uniref:DUF4083 family protein n=1 Tax=Paenibacillus azoreducens TaxID=116718 RepID=UPI0039F5B1B7